MYPKLLHRLQNLIAFGATALAAPVENLLCTIETRR